MGSATLIATVLTLLPLFQSQTDRIIVTYNPGDHAIGKETQNAVRDQICNEYNLSPCPLKASDFPYVFSRSGSANVISASYGENQKLDMCVVAIPSSDGGGRPYSSSYIGHSKEVEYEYAYEYFDQIPAFNLLTQLAACATVQDTQVHRERNVAFSTLMLQLLVGDKNFIGEERYSLSEVIAEETQSTAVVYANSVAQRILAEEFKKNAVAILRQAGACSISHTKGDQPWSASQAPSSPDEQASLTSGCLSGSSRGQRISVDDDLLINIYPSSLPVENSEDELEVYAPRPATVFDPIFSWTPMKNFDGSLERGFWYSWRTANTLSGIR